MCFTGRYITNGDIDHRVMVCTATKEAPGVETYREMQVHTEARWIGLVYSKRDPGREVLLGRHDLTG